MALIAARESRQGDSRVMEATWAWVRFWAARVARRKLPIACWAASSPRVDEAPAAGVAARAAVFFAAFLPCPDLSRVCPTTLRRLRPSTWMAGRLGLDPPAAPRPNDAACQPATLTRAPARCQPGTEGESLQPVGCKVVIPTARNITTLEQSFLDDDREIWHDLARLGSGTRLPARGADQRVPIMKRREGRAPTFRTRATPTPPTWRRGSFGT